MFMKIAKAYEALTDQQVRMRATRRKLYPSITVSFMPSCKLAALLLLGQDRSKRSMKIVTYTAACIDRRVSLCRSTAVMLTVNSIHVFSCLRLPVELPGGV